MELDSSSVIVQDLGFYKIEGRRDYFEIRVENHVRTPN